MSAGRTGATALATLALAVLLVASLAAPVVAIHDADRRFVVELRTDGSAQVTAERNYNLSTPAEREQFAAYVNNSTRLNEARTAFRTRLQRAAANGSDATVRQMRIANVTAGTVRANGTGTVELRARWVGLGGVYGGLVVVNEPFTSSFDPNGTLVVRGPPGYIRGSLNPPPGVARRNIALWGEETDLSGFSARFRNPQATTGGGGDEGASGGGGGSGAQDTPVPEGVGRLVGAAGVALVPALLVVFGVQRRRFLLAAETDTGAEPDADAESDPPAAGEDGADESDAGGGEASESTDAGEAGDGGGSGDAADAGDGADGVDASDDG
jgi:hypothetical protein